MQINNEPISKVARQLVRQRANFQCEYCLLNEKRSFIGFEVDHIISRKHRGSNDPNNLAYSCGDCNRNKGTDIASIDCNRNKGTDIASIDWNNNNQITRFYNPRLDLWAEHFRLSNTVIESLTSIGEVTITIFRFNDQIRLTNRGRF